MMVVDASILVSYMVPNDVNHEKAVKWIKKISLKEAFLIPEIALIEIACVLTRIGTEENLINEWLIWIRKFSLIAGKKDSSEQPSLEEIILEAKRTGCRAGDVFYVALAVKHAIPIASFDKDQLMRAKKVAINIIEP